MKKLSVKQLISIGSVVSLGGLALTFNVNQDFRTIVKEGTVRLLPIKHTIHDTVRTPAPPPDTVEISVSDPGLLPAMEGAFDEAVAQMQTEFQVIADQVGTIEAAVASVDSSHQELVDRVRELAAREHPKPMIYVVIDSVFTPVDPDSIQDAEEWLRLLWPWYKTKGVKR